MSWGRGGGSRSGVIRWKVCPPAVRVLKYSRRVTRSINGKSLLGKMAERERKKKEEKLECAECAECDASVCAG